MLSMLNIQYIRWFQFLTKIFLNFNSIYIYKNPENFFLIHFTILDSYFKRKRWKRKEELDYKYIDILGIFMCSPTMIFQHCILFIMLPEFLRQACTPFIWCTYRKLFPRTCKPTVRGVAFQIQDYRENQSHTDYHCFK